MRAGEVADVSRQNVSSHVMLCYVMLCYVMLCYVMLCYVMLCYVMLCYVMLCYVMLCYVMLCYVMLCYVMLCYAMFWGLEHRLNASSSLIGGAWGTKVPLTLAFCNYQIFTVDPYKICKMRFDCNYQILTVDPYSYDISQNFPGVSSFSRWVFKSLFQVLFH